MQFNIPAQHKKSSGIYAIRNLVDERIYVGSAQRFALRYSNHKNELHSGRHHSASLQDFADSYGVDSLTFELLEVVEKGQDLGEAEQRWLDKTNAYSPAHGFNYRPKATSRIAADRLPKVTIEINPELQEALVELKRTTGITRMPELARFLLIEAVAARAA